MAESFRLRSVTYAGRGRAEVRVHLSEASHYETWTSVVTGKNGVGKSRLLSQIAGVFDALDSGKPRSGFDASVDYSMGSSHCKIVVSKGRVETTIGGVRVEPARMPVPGSVAAVTTSAFDKFILPSASVSTEQVPLYRYLGLKDAQGRISATAGVHRALDGLFAAANMDEPRRSRVADVFFDLDYEPRVEVAYRWTKLGTEAFRAFTLGLREYDQFQESIVRARTNSNRVNPSNFNDESANHDLIQALELFTSRGQGRELILIADFEYAGFENTEHFRAAQLLKRLGMIAMKSVTLVRSSVKDRIDLLDTSSGELSLVTAILGIASAIDNTSLVLIDEPEISLHPHWQSDYLNRLNRTFGRFKGCHFIVATHSPLIVSGIDATHGNVLSLERDLPFRRTSDFSGKSTDEVLIGAFNVAGKNNLFLKQSLVRALRLAADRKFDSPEFAELLGQLKDATRASGVNEGVRRVLSDLETTVAKARVSGS